MASRPRRSFRGWLQFKLRQWQCAHHWHPDGFIAWDCCWCEKDVDGWPRDLSPACRREADEVNRSWTSALSPTVPSPATGPAARSPMNDAGTSTHGQPNG